MSLPSNHAPPVLGDHLSWVTMLFDLAEGVVSQDRGPYQVWEYPKLQYHLMIDELKIIIIQN